MPLQLHYINYPTPRLQPHYATTTTTAALHHATSSSCGWGDRPGDHCNHCDHSAKTRPQPPFSPSVDSLCHPWFTTTKLSYRFPILKRFEASATALCGTTGNNRCRWCIYALCNVLHHHPITNLVAGGKFQQYGLDWQQWGRKTKSRERERRELESQAGIIADKTKWTSLPKQLLMFMTSPTTPHALQGLNMSSPRPSEIEATYPFGEL